MAAHTDIRISVLQEELRELLERISPDEAAWSKQYAEDVGTRSASERAFGIAGGGTELVLGAFFAQVIVEVAKAVIEALKKEGADRVAKAALDWLTRKVRDPGDVQIARLTKAETIGTVASALTRAGWNDVDAASAAQEVWQTGERTAGRLLKVCD
jgi:hypothetical protein